MIAFDASGTGNGSGASVTFAHNVGTGNNRILFVGVGTDTGGADTVSGITYNSVSMTLVDKQQYSGATGFVYLYYLIAPASGNNNVVVSASGGNLRCCSLSYTGAKQTAQPDASGKKSSAAVTSQSLAVVTVADNSWMVSHAQSDNSVPTASTGITDRNGSGINSRIGDSGSAITPAQSYNMTWTLASGKIAVVQASFAPALNTTGGAFLFNFV